MSHSQERNGLPKCSNTQKIRNIKIQTSVVEVWTRNFSVGHIFTGMKLQIEAWLLCKMVVKFTIMGEEFDGREIIMFDSEWYMKREDY